MTSSLDRGHALLTGWGRTSPTGARVHAVRAADDVPPLLRCAPRGALARGLGRSYGDAAQNAGGTVIDTTGMSRVVAFDTGRGVLDAEAGASLDSVLRTTVPRGWFVGVTPGTRHVTVGGAIAADVHGKNHHVDGGFCDHVESFDLATPAGTVHATPGTDAFEATAGGMGLTGVVTRATLRLVEIETSIMVVDTLRSSDVDETMDEMRKRDHEYRYSVAWIDCLAGGRHLGRSVLTRAMHATRDDLPPRRRTAPLRFDPSTRLRSPPWFPRRALNRVSVAAFNEAWYRRAPRRRDGHLETIASYFHPLDGVAGWNRLYGTGGFVQYQFVVPDTAADTVRLALQKTSAAGCPSLFAVLKRFGPGRGLLSFPVEGWTLAADFPARAPGLARLLDDLDDLVAGAGGRVYLAKDSRMRAGHLEAMYPELERWRRMRDRLDPDGVFVSDLARRTGLLGERA